jgi:hypothetical protein
MLACSKENGPTGPLGSETVRGKVTYKGQVVPYGYVLFYSLGEKPEEKQPGELKPSGFGAIDKDGTYEVLNLPKGPAMVVVGTDPEVDLPTLMKAGMGGMEVMELPTDPSQGPPPPPKFDPTKILPDPKSKIPNPPADPNLKKGPLDPKTFDGPPPDPSRPPVFNPVLQNLTDDQKKTLKEIHERYGVVGKSPLMYVIREGVQTFDITMK